MPNKKRTPSPFYPPNATVKLQGCNTAYGDESFAKHLSQALPGRTVIGHKSVIMKIAPNTVWGSERKFKDGNEVP